MSNGGMRLTLDEAVETGAAVRVQGDDWLVLAEVCYCRTERSGYLAGLQIDQVLMGLSALSERNRVLLGPPEVLVKQNTPV